MKDGNGDGGARTRQWLLAARIAIVTAWLLGLISPALGGRAGGSLVILSGVGFLLTGTILLRDTGGVGRAVGAIYQETIQRHVPGARPPDPSQQLLVGRWTGGGLALIGLAFCGAGLALLVGWLRMG